ncbi:MAG: sulfatase-like hydrolase/transferase [Rhodopirellula sp.]|nr:sulfatase-like hydrolase/transferase [Rhodopirellula sp.]
MSPSRFAWMGPYRAVALIFLAAVSTFSLLRVALLVAYAEWGAIDLTAFTRIMWVGFRFDIMVGLCFVLWQTVHITFVPESRRLGRFSRIGIEFEWIVAGLILPLLFAVEWLFFDEFQSRLNYIAFEYLVYPTEVCCNIWQSYSIIPIVSCVTIAGGTLYLYSRRPLLNLVASSLPLRNRLGFLSGVLTAIVGLWVTTGMDSRNVSRDRVAVECAGNGLYSFVYYALTCRLDYDENYLTIDEPDALARVRQQVVGPNDYLIEGSSNPVDRIVSTGQPQRDWNVVLILEESLGSDFVGVLGDKRGLTPELDALCKEGQLFDQWYATGNRTARALEAVMTSMPPIPTESILKRDHSARVFTLADALQERGYERLFMTGGRGLFDGVRSFMTNNGFNHFIEQSDFPDPVFANAWGVSDEDLFRRGVKELDKLHATGKPFFATLLTVSNHRPYTYPEGRISEMAQTRDNAVRYADYALGYFFREARSHDFYRNTLFVVMGDHGARVYGSQMFPLQSYRVPVVMLQPDGSGHGTRCSTLGCSLDIAPTIMARLGGEYRSVFFGRDVVSMPPDEGRAVMQHNHDVALLNTQQQLVNLGFNRTAWEFEVGKVDFSLTQQRLAEPEDLQNTAALFQTAYQLYYSDKWFPDQSVSGESLSRRDKSAF